MSAQNVGAKGQFSDRPLDIPRAGWWSVLLRVKDEIGKDNVGVLSAGVAFYAFLASFPAIASIVLLYGLFADPADVQKQLSMLSDVIPAEAFQILETQTSAVVSQANRTLGVGLIMSLALSIWSATKGIKALLIAINVAYEEHDERGFIWATAWTIMFTVGAGIFLVVSLALIAAIPAAVSLLAPDSVLGHAILWARWAVMALLAILALGLLYNLGPSRRRAAFRWVTPGAVFATALWIVGSVAFSFYVERFATYNATFGSLGAVVILLMWLYLSAYIICLGAELNAELEHQTRRDTTVGPNQPMGSRGAYVADHVPPEV